MDEDVVNQTEFKRIKSKLLFSLKWHRAVIYAICGILAWFELCGYWIIHSEMVKLSSRASSGVLALGIVFLGFILVLAYCAYSTYAWEMKMLKKESNNTIRRKPCPAIDDNPNIKIEKAWNLARFCGHCQPEKTDYPEMLIVNNEKLNAKFYQVRCPKCWTHTAFFDTPDEAIKAWNECERWTIKGEGDEEV